MIETTYSKRMAGVRRAGTKPELEVGRLLRDAGFRYRRNVRGLPGSPDFANKSNGWAVFVNGCFWHAHTGCKRATTPKSNEAFWKEKLRQNRRRDASAIWALRKLGISTKIVWECEVADATKQLSKFFESRGIQICKPLDH